MERITPLGRYAELVKDNMKGSQCDQMREGIEARQIEFEYSQPVFPKPIERRMSAIRQVTVPSRLLMLVSARLTCPSWLEFLDWMCSGDTGEVRLIGQFAAWAFASYRLKLEKVLWLQGRGGNGKSTALTILRHVLGTQSTAAVGLHSFAGEGADFRLWKLVDKIANFAPDVDVRRHQPVATINAFVSGDAFTINRKFREAVTVEPSTVLFFGSNALPIFPDTSDAWWRRLLLIRCRQRPNDEDATLKDRLLNECPGILNWILAELPGLIARKKFDIPESVASNVAYCKLQVNSCRLFVSTKLMKGDAQAFCDGKQVMGIYQNWCKETGYKEEDLGTMRDEVLRTFGVEYERHRIKMGIRDSRPYGWRGVRFQPDEEPGKDPVILQANRATQLEQTVDDLRKQLAKLKEKKRIPQPLLTLGTPSSEGIEQLIAELSPDVEEQEQKP